MPTPAGRWTAQGWWGVSTTILYNTLTATASGIPSSMKQARIIRQVIGAGSSIVSKFVSARKSVSASGSVSIRKTTSKYIESIVIGAGLLVNARIYLKSLVADATGIGDLDRSISKVLSATASSTMRIIKDVHKRISSTASGAGNSRKAILISTTVSGIGTAVDTYLVRLTSTAMGFGLGIIQRNNIFNKFLTASASGIASSTRQAIVLLYTEATALATGNGSINKYIMRVMRAVGLGSGDTRKDSHKVLSATGSGDTERSRYINKASIAFASANTTIRKYVGKVSQALSSVSGLLDAVLGLFKPTEPSVIEGFSVEPKIGMGFAVVSKPAYAVSVIDKPEFATYVDIKPHITFSVERKPIIKVDNDEN